MVLYIEKSTFFEPNHNFEWQTITLKTLPPTLTDIHKFNFQVKEYIYLSIHLFV